MSTPGMWRPVPGRIGHEDYEYGDHGQATTVLGGREPFPIDERSLVTAPALSGRHSIALADGGLVGPVVHGHETHPLVESLAGGMAFTRTETFPLTEAGVHMPTALAGHEAHPLTEQGSVIASANGIETAPLYVESGQGWFAWEDIADVTVTATGYSQTRIPVRCRYIDVILLGAGGGGAGGERRAFVVGGDGNGGKAGQYASYRYDRGESRNTWFNVSIEVGAGGSGGSRNNNGAGGAGGATKMWMDYADGYAGIYLEGPGGAGGSGKTFGGGISGDQNGKAPGNHTFQGKTANGGGENGGTPGGGGKGGGGALSPFNAGTGEVGARGQAWIRFSYS